MGDARRLFHLRTEVTLRFMVALNPCPISALIEAICIVTKIIRDNFIGIFKKIIITFHIFKLCKRSGHLMGGSPGPELRGPVLEDPTLHLLRTESRASCNADRNRPPRPGPHQGLQDSQGLPE